MKLLQVKHLILLSLLFLSTSAFSQNSLVSAKVDERAELISIVFRLANASEYTAGRLPAYNHAIDTYFEPWKSHKVIKQAKRLRLTSGIAFNAVMDMATHLEINNGKISMLKDVDKSGMDQRWKAKTITSFVENLDDFYKVSQFHHFFEKHKDLYSLAEERFNAVLQNVDFNWFSAFFGQEMEDSFRLIISLSNGPSNYGSSVSFNNKNKIIYAILGTWYTDSLGNPTYYTNAIPTVIHEFNHSFCNPLNDSNFDTLKTSAQLIYAKVKGQIKNYAYGSALTMLNEALVRASVIKYLEAHDSTVLTVNREKAINEGKGFIWVSELVNKLDEYGQNRNKYKTLESFMPEIIRFYDSLAANFDAFYTDFIGKCPQVLSSTVKNKSKVDASLKEIVFKFSKPMQKYSNGFSYGKGGIKHFLKPIKSEWIDNQTLRLTVALEKGQKYSMKFYNPGYVSEDNYPMIEPFELEFIAN